MIQNDVNDVEYLAINICIRQTVVNVKSKINIMSEHYMNRKLS